MSFITFIFSRKILSSLLVLAVIVPSIFLAIPPQRASAQWTVFDPINFGVNSATSISTGISAAANTVSAVNSTTFNVKKFLLDGLAWTIAKLVLRGITAQTVNWINGGFQGNPAFVTDPTQFFSDVSDLAVIKALGDQGVLLNKLCTPFKPQIRLALVQNYLQQGQVGQCSITQIVKNYDAFTQDFSQGGWQGWFSMTQNMQNNPYGSYLSAQNELTLSVSNQTTKYQQQLDWGKGFLSYEKCDAPAAGPPSISGSGGYPDYASEAGFAQYNCKTVTPGSIVEDQLSQNLGSGVKSLEAADEINEIVGALMTEAIKSVVGGITTGLRGLSQSSAASPKSLVQQLQATSFAQEGTSTPSLSNIQAALPASLAQAVDPSATSTPIVPVIDQAAIDAQIAAQKIKFKQEYGSCATDSGGQLVCTGGSSSSSSGGGTTSNAICGNFVCEDGEMSTCPNDCSYTGGTCGNNFCEGIEWQTCPQDCAGVTP